MPDRIATTWRRMADSLREATRLRMIPEYHHHADRSYNHRYYR